MPVHTVQLIEKMVTKDLLGTYLIHMLEMNCLINSVFLFDMFGFHLLFNIGLITCLFCTS